jgi:hypothetical protein
MDPLAGASSGTDPIAWVGLAAAVVALASWGLAEPVRLTLWALVLYTLLVNAGAIAPALERLAAALRVSGAAPTRQPSAADSFFGGTRP